MATAKPKPKVRANRRQFLGGLLKLCQVGGSSVGLGQTTGSQLAQG